VSRKGFDARRVSTFTPVVFSLFFNRVFITFCRTSPAVGELLIDFQSFIRDFFFGFFFLSESVCCYEFGSPDPPRPGSVALALFSITGRSLPPRATGMCHCTSLLRNGLVPCPAIWRASPSFSRFVARNFESDYFPPPKPPPHLVVVPVRAPPCLYPFCSSMLRTGFALLPLLVLAGTIYQRLGRSYLHCGCSEPDPFPFFSLGVFSFQLALLFFFYLSPWSFFFLVCEFPVRFLAPCEGVPLFFGHAPPTEALFALVPPPGRLLPALCHVCCGLPELFLVVFFFFFLLLFFCFMLPLQPKFCVSRPYYVFSELGRLGLPPPS